jgi:hypothetical protein
MTPLEAELIDLRLAQMAEDAASSPATGADAASTSCSRDAVSGPDFGQTVDIARSSCSCGDNRME